MSVVATLASAPNALTAPGLRKNGMRSIIHSFGVGAKSDGLQASNGIHPRKHSDLPLARLAMRSGKLVGWHRQPLR